MKKDKIVGIISALLVLLFIYAGFSKLFNMEEFTGTLSNQPISHRLALGIAWSVPIIEILIASCLLFEGTKKTGFYASFLLLSIFTLYIGAVLLHFFPRTPCSCGGVIRKLSWQQHLWFNFFFLFLSLLAIFLETKKPIPSQINSLL